MYTLSVEFSLINLPITNSWVFILFFRRTRKTMRHAYIRMSDFYMWGTDLTFFIHTLYCLFEKNTDNYN